MLIAAVVRSFMPSVIAGSREVQTLSLTYPHKKKSHTGGPAIWQDDRITVAINTVDRDMLKRVWDEFSYRIDVVRAAGCGHIEHL